METPSHNEGRPEGLGAGHYFDGDRGPLASTPIFLAPVIAARARPGQCPIFDTRWMSPFRYAVLLMDGSADAVARRT
jgi:hypothetical protein